MGRKRCILGIKTKTVQKHKMRNTNPRKHPFPQCKVTTIAEDFISEKWERQNKKKYYIDKMKLEE